MKHETEENAQVLQQAAMFLTHPALATILAGAVVVVVVALALGQTGLPTLAPLSPLDSPLGTPLKRVSDVNEPSGTTTVTDYGDVVTYTLTLVGTGEEGPAYLTDTLPAGVTYVAGTLSASSGSAVISSGVLTWTGSVSLTNPVTIVFRVQLGGSLIPGDIITNAFTASSLLTPLIQSNVVTTTVGNRTYYAYLPIVRKPAYVFVPHVSK
ncbi:MAG: hypothetical protein RMN25_03795 [Anaerolineae bacterium]|nr:hypothetical protein [Thermoflexales bacterium]MDW8406884.1 hypothetical protein [Anaerolineae bacterium]